jgi:protoheme IX farnesyltransferase
MAAFKAYYSVLKPERTYANVMTTAAGFLFACRWHIDLSLLLATIFGTSFIVASACAVNNYLDRELDAKMPRTKKRALVQQTVSPQIVLGLATVFFIGGFTLLIAYVNWLTVLVGAIGYVDYVVFYGWSKRTTVHSTLIGTISGAAPIVAGYTAVVGRFDVTAAILALIMVFWQMVHFYAIGIFRRDDYAAGSIPIWPVKKGVRSTQYWMLAYTVLYLAAVTALAAWGHAGYVYLVVIGLLGLYWLWLGLKGLKSIEATKWARSMFGFSLVTLLVLSGVLSLSPLFP